jgi:hypothetical protein
MEQHNPDSQVEVIDDDEVPQQYRTDRNTSGGGRTRGSVRNNAHSSFRRKTRSTQCTLSFHGSKGTADDQVAPQGAPVQESPGFFEAISRWVPMPQRFSPNAKDTRKQKGNVDTVVKIEVTQEWDRDIDQTQSFQNQMIELERGFQNTLQGKESEWMAIQQDLQRQLSQANRHAAENNRMFQARLHDIQLEKSALEEQHNAFIRKQQEASFRQMESARWHPVDETKVMSNLDMLKKDMRKWAKTASVKGISLLQSLGEVKHAALMEQLKNVAVIENGQLPEGITTTAKSPMLLLNALLADHVYASFFRSLFFFLGGNCENPLSKARPEAILEDIYRGAKDGKLILIYTIACR